MGRTVPEDEWDDNSDDDPWTPEKQAKYYGFRSVEEMNYILDLPDK